MYINTNMSEDTSHVVGEFTSNNWYNYQRQIHKYLSSVENNPYVLELSTDFKKIGINKIIKPMSSGYKKWISSINTDDIFTDTTVNTVNALFNTDNLMKQFINCLEERVTKGDLCKLQEFLTLDNLNQIKQHVQTIIPSIKFCPSDLKFVTTTGLGILDTTVDFAYLYKYYTPPIKIVKSQGQSTSEPIFYPEVINTVVGCKTGNLPIKGFFKKSDVGDFYNCATLQVVLGESKCANVKLFNNGKLQLTGIPHPDLGPVAIKIVCDLIKSIPDEKETGNKIVFDKKRVEVKEYKTVMINTCYDLKISLDRNIVSSILSKRYNFNTVWEGDGYPGVRVLYYYNKDTVGTSNDGICMCSKNYSGAQEMKCDKMCSGKGTGSGQYNCRKISIAIFQSGKIIIAGGCQDVEPIYNVYNRFNKIIEEIMPEIQKLDDETIKQATKQGSKKIYLEISKITNYHEYSKLIKHF